MVGQMIVVGVTSGRTPDYCIDPLDWCQRLVSAMYTSFRVFRLVRVSAPGNSRTCNLRTLIMMRPEYTT